jgi:hypothetical protein
LSNAEVKVVMKKFLLRSIGVADIQTGQTASLPACLEMVVQRSDALIQGVLDGLLSSGVQGRSPGAMSRHSVTTQAAAEFLMSQAPAVRKTFVSRVRRNIYQPVALEAQDQTPVRFEDLHLLDSGQIDVNIEFALAQQEVDRSVDEVLPALNALISSLLGWTTVQGAINPMKPQAFVRALQDTLAKHSPDEPSRAALILPAAGLLGVGLRQLYKELTAWLRAQSVEPAASAATLVGSLSRAREGRHAEDSGSLVRRLLTMDKLRRLLSGELDDPAPLGFLHTMPASFVAMEDLQLIEPMMRRLSERAAAVADVSATPRAGKKVKVGIALESDGPQGKVLGRQLTKEVVGMMIERLAHDERLLPPVSQLIQSMEPVLLALAQADPRFFSERQHPARLLLDRVMDQSLAFGAVTEEGFGKFLTAISNAVASLSASAGGSEDFAAVLKSLEAGWARDEAAQRQQLEEAARALLHAEQRNLLAQRWAEDFKSRMLHKVTPDWMSSFLRGPWAQVVAQDELACKDGRSDPGGYVELVDELLWSVQPEQTRHSRPRLVGLVPGMLVKLRQGLQSIDFPADRLPLIFDALITEHEKAFDGPRMGDSTAVDDLSDQRTSSDLNALPSMDNSSLWVANGEAQESGYLSGDVDQPEEPAVRRVFSARDLSIGVWVELIVEGQWLRAQLTWASPHRTLFMFVARGGTAHSMSRRTMERLRMQGAIRVVSEGHLVDKALDSVAQAALRNDGGEGRNPH